MTLDHNSSEDGALYYGMNGYGISWLYFLLNLIFVFVAIFGIVLNSVVFFVIKKDKRCTEVSQICIKNLAISDTVTGLVCLYSLMYNLIHFKNYYECAIRLGFVSNFSLNSAVHLLFLTLDRYCQIHFPLRYWDLCNEKIARICSRCAWVSATVFSLLPIAGWRKPSPKGVQYCSFFGVLTNSYLALIVVLFCVIFIMVVFCYGSILHLAFRKIKTEAGIPGCNHKTTWWKPTKTVLMLASLYIVCWVPTGIFLLLHVAGTLDFMTNEKKGSVFTYLGVFIVGNAIGNPVIFTMKSRTVKNNIRKLFKLRTNTSDSSHRGSQQTRKDSQVTEESVTTLESASAFVSQGNVDQSSEGEGQGTDMLTPVAPPTEDRLVSSENSAKEGQMPSDATLVMLEKQDQAAVVIPEIREFKDGVSAKQQSADLPRLFATNVRQEEHESVLESVLENEKSQ